MTTPHATTQDGRIELRRYDPAWQMRWDDFVERARNGTLFHLQKFLGYHAPGRFADHSLMFLRGGRLLAVFPAAERTEEREKTLVSHPGSSYGGLVFGDALRLTQVDECVKALVAHARDGGFQEIRMRLPERVFHKRPDDELDYALWSNGFRFKGREISTAIPLDFTEADLWQQLEGGSSRSAARKAQRAGIRVGLSEDYDSFCPIAQKNLASRHKTKPVHSLDEMKKIRDLFPDRVFLFAAHKDDRMIAGVWALLVNSNGLHTFYVDQNYEFQRDRPLDLIFVELIRWALQRRYRFINLGISTNQGGSQLDEGLQRFKERHGGRGVMREIYFLKLTPNEKTAEPNPMA